MPKFIKIKEARINVERINNYEIRKQNDEFFLIIVFGQADEFQFKTKDKHELENWLKALGEEK